MSALHDFIVHSAEHWGYLGIFVLMTLESACIPIPSEITMPVGGWLAFQGTLNLWIVALTGAFANLVGSWIAYAVGAAGGRPFIVRWGHFVRLHERDLDRSHAWFERYGPKAVFWSRLVPVVRTFISLPAGIARMELKRFSVYSFAGSLPWCLGLAYGGYALGQNWETLASDVRVVTYVVVGLLVVAGVLLALRARRRANAPG